MITNRSFRQQATLRLSLLLTTFILIIPSTHAALPTPVAPSAGAADGNWLQLIRGYLQDGGIILGLAISVIGFLWVSYMGFAKFNEARTGRAEWAEVGVLGIAGGALLLFVTFLLNVASTIFN